MRTFLAFVLLLSMIGAAPVHSQTLADESMSCGVERWPVKTLTDADASSVNLTPSVYTVDELRGLPVPAGYDAHSVRRYPAEKQTADVKAMLVGWKRESDYDFHIVIAPPGHPERTMIVEVPDPECTDSSHDSEFRAVRDFLIQCFGDPGAWHKLPHLVVDVVGVIYYDPLHGQTGVSPNGLELHPILRLKVLQGACPH